MGARTLALARSLTVCPLGPLRPQSIEIDIGDVAAVLYRNDLLVRHETLIGIHFVYGERSSATKEKTTGNARIRVQRSTVCEDPENILDQDTT